MRKDISISGFGGQGIILTGIMLAKLAERYPDMHVAQAQSYGPTARGGACRSDVVYSDHPINYPKSETPALMIFMSQAAAQRYLPLAGAEKTLVVYDSTPVEALDAPCRAIGIPATELAETKLKNRMVANIFILGAVADVLIPGCHDRLRKVIMENVPQKFSTVNGEAFDMGTAHARDNFPELAAGAA